MTIEAIEMVWIAVSDLKKSVKFYTETVGLKLLELSEEYGWAELGGHNGGSRFGLAQMPANGSIRPGQNGVVTFTVEDLEKATKDLVSKGGRIEGDAEEVPGHVKLQMAIDADGNRFQYVQKLF